MSACASMLLNPVKASLESTRLTPWLESSKNPVVKNLVKSRKAKQPWVDLHEAASAFQGNENVARWRPKPSNRHMMGMKQDRSYVSEVKGSDVNTEKCVSQGAESPRADENELPRGESFPHISSQAIFTRAGRRPKSAAERI